MLPEPEILHGLTWPGLFFADQRFPIKQILHGVFEISAIVLLTAGLTLLFQRRGWSVGQISVTGAGLTLLSLGALWLWESGGSACFMVFMVGLCLAISPWLGTSTTCPRLRRTPTS
ncbi:hypothetical protein [Deinococcus sp. Leaf326]|uniref:hypothetical protein n=1 Tax=Deinococcus sp. Leaf326 TaxID=1736338 RepID=UPI0006F9F0AE|nr:hypothetical protein [Deinococcus sp. Leaf326]KQR02748.1 hypothetical protein ASF71_21385 [Deinococcus sp. Leaf326]